MYLAYNCLPENREWHLRYISRINVGFPDLIFSCPKAPTPKKSSVFSIQIQDWASCYLRCNTIYLGAACAFLICVLMLSSMEASCSHSCCFLEHKWFKWLSRRRQTKRSYKAEKAALGGQYAISEKQGKWTLARKEEVWTPWSFLFCGVLGHHICSWLMMEPLTSLAWWQM